MTGTESRLAAFFLTMQRDEHEMLPLTLRHHAQFFKPTDMYVIDHGSIRNIVPDGLSRIFLPGTRPYSEKSRRDAVAAIASALLEYYDWGVYADCDELLDLTSFRPEDLEQQPVIYVAGFAVARMAQGTHSKMIGILDPTMCKPLIFRQVPDWGLGFHGCSSVPQSNLSVPMAHLKYFDPGTATAIAERRVATYRTMNTHEKQLGIAQSWSSDGMSASAFLELATSLIRAGGTPRPFAPVASADVLASRNGYFSAAPRVQASPVDLTANFSAVMPPADTARNRNGIFRFFR